MYPYGLKVKIITMRRKTCFFFAVILFFVNFSFSSSLIKDINVSLREKRIIDFGTNGLSLVFYVNISNSSSKTYYLSSYNYRFVVNQKEYLRLQTSLEEWLKIDASRNTVIALPVRITYEHLFQTVKGIEEEDNASCYLMGELAFSHRKRERGRLPVAFSGEFPIFKKPDVKDLLLRVNALTIGGADLSFDIKFKNRNGFELLVNSISYEINLRSYLIGKGMISGDKNIEKHGAKVFTLPILLNFFEVGKDVYSILQQSSTLCRFSGEVEIQTVWGRLVIPFDKSEKITISK